MALDIWIGKWDEPGGRLALSIEEEAYYCQLHPLIEQAAADGGKYIDLYGIAEYTPEELALVEALISRAREQAEAKPQHWKISIGISSSGELWGEIDRAKFLAFLAKWQLLVHECRKYRKSMHFVGE